MPESLLHTQLVKALSLFIADQYLEGDTGCLLNDSAGTQINNRCYEINEFIPDVIACTLKNPEKIIIGEAKTPKDLETRHTLMQLLAFIRYCAQKNNGTMLIIAVPWYYHRRARQIVSIIERKQGLKKTYCLVPDRFRG